MTENEGRAPTAGQTGGLPGANAAPGTAEISEDERTDTVSGAGVGDLAATGDEDTGYTGSNG